MEKTFIHIQHIPAIIWGAASDKVFLYVHGQGGNKTEAETFASIAGQKSYQVLSIDLPEHGDRAHETKTFDPWHAIPELTAVLEYAKTQWPEISLYANSIGAWFSILSFQNELLKKCLFVSPILDMAHLIENMMSWAGVSEEQLQLKGEIPTSFGQTLSWQYFLYARSHTITKWNPPTEILYGETDNLTELSVVNNFAKRFACNTTIMEHGEHWFHTAEQLNVLNQWVLTCLSD